MVLLKIDKGSAVVRVGIDFLHEFPHLNSRRSDCLAVILPNV